uniref:RNA pseudouridine synthase 2, chloroplastic n=1 Tax=Anthurium amnicola TaxID=1678845 RepID=A0A1D1Z8A2_9ARAE
MMLSLPAAGATSHSLCVLRRRAACRLPNLFCSSPSCSESISEASRHQVDLHGRRGNRGGVRLEESVEKGMEKSRLDSWISSRIHGVSRARVQASIRSGLVTVNGRTVDKVSHIIKAGDKISCTVSELQPLRAEPEDIPLDIVYEDAHILVVNKPAHMVVHPAPGNANGTLVNAILHHCQLPTITCADKNMYKNDDSSETSDSEFDYLFSNKISRDGLISKNLEASVRPGIVHRLDKGTSGLLVVAKSVHMLYSCSFGTD